MLFRSERGRTLPLTKTDPSTYEDWLTLAVDNGSVIAISSLARFYRQQDTIHQEFRVWGREVALGYASGFLEQGQILENCGRWQEALALYRQPNAGSYGLYDYIRKYGPDSTLLEEAETKNKKNYIDLLAFLNSY